MSCVLLADLAALVTALAAFAPPKARVLTDLRHSALVDYPRERGRRAFRRNKISVTPAINTPRALKQVNIIILRFTQVPRPCGANRIPGVS